MPRLLISMIVVLASSAACSPTPSDLPKVQKPPAPAKPSARLRGPVDWRLSPQDAETILIETNMLVLGEPSRQIQAFNVTMEQTDAKRRFIRVADRGNLSGQLYALCALGVLDALEASKLAARLAQDRKKVTVFDRGIESEQPAADLVRLVRDPEVLVGLKQFRVP